MWINVFSGNVAEVCTVQLHQFVEVRFGRVFVNVIYADHGTRPNHLDQVVHCRINSPVQR